MVKAGKRLCLQTRLRFCVTTQERDGDTQVEQAPRVEDGRECSESTQHPHPLPGSVPALEACGHVELLATVGGGLAHASGGKILVTQEEKIVAAVESKSDVSTVKQDNN